MVGKSRGDPIEEIGEMLAEGLIEVEAELSELEEAGETRPCLNCQKLEFSLTKTRAETKKVCDFWQNSAQNLDRQLKTVTDERDKALINAAESERRKEILERQVAALKYLAERNTSTALEAITFSI